jgi:EVE domain-containing protein
MRRYVHEVVSRPRAWVGVVSRSHVRRGVAGGFAQLCHGRCGPLMKMGTGDWLVYYSPRTDYPSGAPLRAFTALGRVVGESAYEVDMGRGFVPYRRDIAYVKGTREVPLRDLASTLEFVTGRPSWGMLARRGHFEISLADLRRIAAAMGDPEVRPVA